VKVPRQQRRAAWRRGTSVAICVTVGPSAANGFRASCSQEADAHPKADGCARFACKEVCRVDVHPVSHATRVPG
jgi:hypothetical protein